MRFWIHRILLIVSLWATFLVYQPGLHGPFVFDDGVNIVRNTKLAIQQLDYQSLKQAALSMQSGPLMRPISMASFAMNFYAAGQEGILNPYYFKLTNLLIHLINGLGIFVLTRLLLAYYRKRYEPDLSENFVQWTTLVVASAWLLHPLNLTSVLYVVQRMTALSALFCIWGLIMFSWGRIKLFEGSRGGTIAMLASLLIFLPLAILSKENGALLPVFMLVIEVSFFHFQAKETVSRRFLKSFYVFSIAVPAAIAFGYVVTHPDWLLAGYKTRDFTLPERLMTEARVLWFYVWQILAPSNAELGLYHDDIVISKNMFNPISTTISILGIAALLWASISFRKKAPLLTFAIAFFFAGHLLESTVFPLEIAHEHRNYLPMFGVLLAFFFYLLYPLRYTNYLRLRQVAAVLLLAMLGYNTFMRSDDWSTAFTLFQAEVLHHPNSALDNGELATLYGNAFSPDPNEMEASYSASRRYFEEAAKLNRGDTKALFGLIFLSEIREKNVERDWLRELVHRLEHAPYAAITSDKLVNLVTCQLTGGCKLDNEDLGKLLNAALRNPTLTGTNRAKVLYALSSYKINVEKDYPAALKVMELMIQADPGEIAFRFPLIHFLLALDQYREAREQLDIVKVMDNLGAYETEIETLAETLSARE